MGEEVAISLQNISKCYKRYTSPVDRLKELFLPQQSRAEEFWALRNISLDIYQGETLGIVGQNGSGKSTLLQIIAGTLAPTQGEASVRGRVSALLELGSGFNPEFTGRQNVFFNGRLLGLTREEIEARFDDIAAFAEIGSFIEHPVKTYSSGMALRLAFAVAASIDPQILIVDEALAVGDVKFQARCMKRIRRLRDQGTTILFVSHDTSSVISLCQRAILLNHGQLLEVGTPKVVVNRYIALLNSNGAEIDLEEEQKLEAYKDPEKVLALGETATPVTSEVSSEIADEIADDSAETPHSLTSEPTTNGDRSDQSSNEDQSSSEIDVETPEPETSTHFPLGDAGVLEGTTAIASESTTAEPDSHLLETDLAASEPEFYIDSLELLETLEPNEPVNQAMTAWQLISRSAAVEMGNSISDVSEVQITVIPELNGEANGATPTDKYSSSAPSFYREVDSSSESELLHDSQLYRYGNQAAVLKTVKVLELGQLKNVATPDKQVVAKLSAGSVLNIIASIEAKRNLSDLVVGISIRNLMGLVVYGTNTYIQNSFLPTLKTGQYLDVNFQLPCCLNKGVYTLTIGLHSEEGASYDWIDELIVLEVANIKKCDGVVDLNANIQVSQPCYSVV